MAWIRIDPETKKPWTGGNDPYPTGDQPEGTPDFSDATNAVIKKATGNFADIPSNLIKGATLGYYPAVPTPEDAGIIHKAAAGGANLLGMGLSLLPVSRGLNAVGMVPKLAKLGKVAPLARGVIEGAETGALYGATRKQEDGEDRLSSAAKDAGVFGTFGAAGGVVGAGLQKAAPKVSKVAKEYATSMSLGAGAGAVQPAKDTDERLTNMATGAATFGLAHAGMQKVTGKKKTIKPVTGIDRGDDVNQGLSAALNAGLNQGGRHERSTAEESQKSSPATGRQRYADDAAYQGQDAHGPWNDARIQEGGRGQEGQDGLLGQGEPTQAPSIFDKLMGKLKDSSGKFETASFPWADVPVLVNPSPAEVQGYLSRVKQQYEQEGADPSWPYLRWFRGGNGDLYVWRAYDAVHEEVSKFFGEKPVSLGFVYRPEGLEDVFPNKPLPPGARKPRGGTTNLFKDETGLFAPFGGDIRQRKGQFSDLGDRKARVEIDDSGARVIPQGMGDIAPIVGSTVKLSDLLDHPALYEKYPELADLPVEIRNDRTSSGYAGKRIGANLEPEDYISIGNYAWVDRSGPAPRKTLLHEIQHILQAKGDFALGGGPFDEGLYGISMRQAEGINQQYRKREKALREQYGEGTPAFWEAYLKLEGEREQRINDVLGKTGEDFGSNFAAYKNLAGEEEARRTVARRHFSPAERMGNPYAGTDVAHPEDLIWRERSGSQRPSHSLEDEDKAKEPLSGYEFMSTPENLKDGKPRRIFFEGLGGDHPVIKNPTPEEGQEFMAWVVNNNWLKHGIDHFDGDQILRQVVDADTGDVYYAPATEVTHQDIVDTFGIKNPIEQNFIHNAREFDVIATDPYYQQFSAKRAKPQKPAEENSLVTKFLQALKEDETARKSAFSNPPITMEDSRKDWGYSPTGTERRGVSKSYLDRWQTPEKRKAVPIDAIDAKLLRDAGLGNGIFQVDVNGPDTTGKDGLFFDPLRVTERKMERTSNRYGQETGRKWVDALTPDAREILDEMSQRQHTYFDDRGMPVKAPQEAFQQPISPNPDLPIAPEEFPPTDHETATPTAAEEKAGSPLQALNNERGSITLGNPFYSAVEKAVNESKQKKWGSGVEFIKWLQSQPGVTKDEIRNLRLLEVLEPEPRPITKDEVLQRIEQNQQQPEDVMFGGKPEYPPVELEQTGPFQWMYKTPLSTRGHYIVEDTGREGAARFEVYPPDHDEDGIPYHARDLEQAKEIIKDHVEGALIPNNAPQYARFSEAGGKPGTYRELFVTLPGDGPSYKVVPAPDGYGFFIQRPDGRYVAGNGVDRDPNGTLNNSLARRWDTQEDAERYGLPHHDETRWVDGHGGYESVKNPVVRIRFDERVIPEKRQKILPEQIGQLMREGQTLYYAYDNEGKYHEADDPAKLVDELGLRPQAPMIERRKVDKIKVDTVELTPYVSGVEQPNNRRAQRVIRYELVGYRNGVEVYRSPDSKLSPAGVREVVGNVEFAEDLMRTAKQASMGSGYSGNVANGRRETISLTAPMDRDGNMLSLHNIASVTSKGSTFEKPAGKRILFIQEMQGPNLSHEKDMPEYLKKRMYDIGVKRILAYAKENGYDGVAWTSGKMQADRYSLSKHIDKLQVIVSPADDNKFRIMGTKDGTHVYGSGDVSYKEMEGLIGKELASKASSQLNDMKTSWDGSPGGALGIYDDGISFSGVEMDMGGEGLKRLYNHDLPAIFEKHGKAKVEMIELPGGKKDGEKKAPKVPYIPITQKTPESYTLYDITSIPELAFKEARKLVHGIAQEVYQAGMKYKEFVSAMKEKAGEFWKHVEPHIQSAWTAAKKAYRESSIGNERGSVGGRKLEAEYPEFADDIKAMRKELTNGQQAQILRAAGIPEEYIKQKVEGFIESEIQARIEDAKIRKEHHINTPLDEWRYQLKQTIDDNQDKGPMPRMFKATAKMSRPQAEKMTLYPGVMADQELPKMNPAKAGEPQPLYQESFDDLKPTPKGELSKYEKWKNLHKFVAGSHLVDKDGEPIRFFHGTTGDFDTFKKEFVGSHSGAEDTKVGEAHFFTNKAKFANKFAMNKAERYSPTGELEQWQFNDAGHKNVMPVYIAPQKPLVIGSEFGQLDPQELQVIIQIATQRGHDAIIVGDKRYLTDNAGVSPQNTVRPPFGQARSQDEFVKMVLWDMEHNSIDPEHLRINPTYKIYGDLHVIALKPNIIKSAIGNQGTYSRRSKNILKTVAPLAIGLGAAAARDDRKRRTP